MNKYIDYLRKYIGKKPIILCGAGVLIFNQKKELLMIHRVDNDCWSMPGGSMEMGEKVEEAAARELFEETGIKVKSLELINVYSGNEMYYKYPNGDEVYYVASVFIGRGYHGEFKYDNIESDDIKFFSLDSLPEKINPPDIHVINDFIKNHIKKMD